MSISLDRKAECSCKTEICKFYEGSFCVDQQVLRLQISVENAVLVQVDEGLKDLVQETLRLGLFQWLVSMRSHVLLQIVFHILKDQVQLLLRVNDLLKPKKYKSLVRFILNGKTLFKWHE